MTINLDIASTVSSVLWPTVILIIIVMFRSRVPDMLNNLFRSVRKIDFAGISLELSEAVPITPDEALGHVDWDQFATGDMIQTSQEDVITQPLVMTTEPADYMVINLGEGHNWLSSRLFILSVIYQRHMGLRAIVFVQTDQEGHQRYIGWANPTAISSSLSVAYPWLEQAYGEAFNAINFNIRGNDSEKLVELVGYYLGLINNPNQLTGLNPNWTQLSGGKFEHASWIDRGKLRTLLNNQLHTETLQLEKVKDLEPVKQIQAVLDRAGEFIALTTAEGVFLRLHDRTKILEKSLQHVIK